MLWVFLFLSTSMTFMLHLGLYLWYMHPINLMFALVNGGYIIYVLYKMENDCEGT